MNFSNLQKFNCSSNKLLSLPENMNFFNLQEFICSHNKLTLLPLCILNWKNIIRILYYNNPIKLLPQIEQFLSNINNSSLNNINIHN